MSLARLDLVLSDVETTRDFSRIDVGRARADAVISFADLGDLLGVDLSSAGDGQLRVSRTFTVLGTDVEPSITVAPTIVDGALSLSEFSVNGAADAAGVVTEALDELLGVAVPLHGIPFDVELDDVGVERDGVHLSLSGSDLRYVSPS